VALALTVGPWGEEPDDDVLAEAWQAYGVLLVDAYPPDRRPWAFWRFEPGVPDDLRGVRAGPDPVEDAERVRGDRADLARRRAAWLAEHNGARSAMKGATGGTTTQEVDTDA
jgi:hypothetical protein